MCVTASWYSMVERHKIHACHVFKPMIKLLVNSFLLLLSRHLWYISKPECAVNYNIQPKTSLTCILFRAGNTKVHAFFTCTHKLCCHAASSLEYYN